MAYLFISLLIISIAILILVIILLFRSGQSEKTFDDSSFYRAKDELRESIASEFVRLNNLLDSNGQKNYMQATKFNEQVQRALESINKATRDGMDSIFRQLSAINNTQQDKLLTLQNVMTENLDRIRKANLEAFLEISKKTEKLTEQVHGDMDTIRKENNEKLDQMRAVVDEKLQQTLDQRISKSFKEVTDNLAKLYESLGNLNSLTTDVQNINKIFSNVKSRGIWGEVQAESILSDILTSEQFVKDYSPRKNREKVEFAIKLPGKNGLEAVYLPIDSKFPVTDYVKYKEAVDSHDDSMIATALKCVKERVLSEAKEIQKKYIVTPETTDFGILFVPAESIYIELLRIPDFVDRLQSEHRVILTGPNNFSALLNSLRLGFKTLQIERYTSQIWHSFEDLKKYFADLSKAIDDSKKAVDKASEQLEGAAKKKEKLSTVLVQMESSAERSSLLSGQDIEDVKFIQ